MHVNRSFLERKTNEHLEEYVQPNSRYISKAVHFAYEILKDRGHPFTASDHERINALIHQKAKDEVFYLHPYHQKIGRLLYLSSAIGIGFLIGIYSQIEHTWYFNLSLLYFIAIFGLGYLISHGYTEIRLALLFLALAGIGGLAYDFSNVLNYPTFAIVATAQLFTLIWATVILFKIPRIREEVANQFQEIQT